MEPIILFFVLHVIFFVYQSSINYFINILILNTSVKIHLVLLNE